MKRYVFGAGKIGKQVVKLLQRIQLNIEYVFDNDENKWGIGVSGVSVVKFEKKYLINEDSLVYVACINYHSILTQLKKEGIPDKRIIVVDTIIADNLLSSIASQMVSDVTIKALKKMPHYDVLFDLSGGMVLGGVEQWNYELAARLKSYKINAAYFVTANGENKIENTLYPSINVKEEADIVSYVKKIMEVSPKVIICNFPFSIMKAACMVKRCYNKDMKIIAIIHNDLELYYSSYNFWESEIDICIGISSKIEKKIIVNKRFAEKFMRLHWRADISSVRNRIYSKDNETIRIGYAGRIVEYQKRLDRTIAIAKELVRRNVDFRIQIAGDGIYRAELESRILENNLEKYFQFLGRLTHDQMQEFWENQDIYLNCSDYEGHSIAQSEAMASGAVPIMMDVSGAQDDIENGENGFIIPVGDVIEMAKKIDWLYRNRTLLPIMGTKSRNRIEANNKLADSDLEDLVGEIIEGIDIDPTI